MTTLALRANALHHKLKSVSIPSVPWKVVYPLGMLLLAGTLVFYIYSINALTQGSYLIKNYHTQMDSLLTENKNLQTDFAQTGFLGNIQEKVNQLNFEKTTRVTYVQISPWRQPTLGMVK